MGGGGSRINTIHWISDEEKIRDSFGGLVNGMIIRDILCDLIQGLIVGISFGMMVAQIIALIDGLTSEFNIGLQEEISKNQLTKEAKVSKISIKISLLNNIAKEGLKNLPKDIYSIHTKIDNYHAIILRSFNMILEKLVLPKSLFAIGRAGSGTNNIPVQKCSEKGIVVFNTPGANANAVKELTIGTLISISRNINESLSFVKSLKGKGDEVPKLVEANKKNYAGTEITGKTIGIIGLGQIGTSVANTAIALGMKVIGHDPFISGESLLRLFPEIILDDNLDKLLARSDYVSLHLPLNDANNGMISSRKFKRMKKGVYILNFSRGELVNSGDLEQAIESDRVKGYATDFPTDKLLSMKNVISYPHSGASTKEAEVNCAVMVVEQLRDFIENGNITNSVNFPNCSLGKRRGTRIVIMNQNIPGMVEKVSTILAKAKINISEMISKSKGDYACILLDVSSSLDKKIEESINNIQGILKVRILT